MALSSARVRALEALQGRDPIEQSLLALDVRDYRLHAGTAPGTSETYIVEFVDGSKAFHKPHSGVNARVAAFYNQTQDSAPINECCTWLLAREFGPPYSEMVPRTVYRELSGQYGSLMAEAVGIPSWPIHLLDMAQLVAAGFFDSVIGQQDRHDGNRRWDLATNSLRLIDHGFTFRQVGDLRHNRELEVVRRNQGSALTAAERDLLNLLLASPDLHGLSSVLESTRSRALRVRSEEMLRTGEILPAPIGPGNP